MPSDNLPEDLTRTPIFPVRVTLPEDAVDGLVLMAPLAPGGVGQARAARWLGAGAATLLVVSATVRTSFTITESAAGFPNARNSVPWSFADSYEARDIQIAALDANSTPGVWEVMF